MGKLPRSGSRSARFDRARGRLMGAAATATIAVMVILGWGVGTPAAAAGPAAINLGTAGSFAILAQADITNSGASVITGNVGLYPGTSVTGFSSAVVNGTMYVNDSTAQQAMTDLATAYNSATPSGTASAGDTSTTVPSGTLSGQTFGPGVYNYTSGLDLTTTVTLDA